MGANVPFYINYLNNELERKIEVNPGYSLRAFAKTLEIDPSQFSKILSRKTIPSLKLTEHILLRLSISEKDRADFITSIAEEQKCKTINSLAPNITDCKSR